jgi:hypothetical protein
MSFLPPLITELEEVKPENLEKNKEYFLLCCKILLVMITII